MAQTQGSLTTTGSVTLTPKPPQDTLVNLAISGTYGTVTFVIEGSLDGTNWFGLAAGDMTSGTTNVTSTISPSDDAEYAWRVPCEGCVAVRARVTAIASGTATFTLASGIFSGLPLAPSQSGGTISSASTFNGDITIADAKNIVLATTTGTKIGTTTLQKLGFYNVTPVIQPVSSADATTGTTGASTGVSLDTTFKGASGSTTYTIGGIVTALKALGLVKA